MADIRSLEHPTLKVPYEILNKKFRTSQKTLDREISQVQGSVTQVEEYIKHCQGDVSGIPVLLETLEDRLKHLQEKSTESVNEEINSSSSCKRRIHHLKVGCLPPTPASEAQWRKTRVDRMLVEHFLRVGYYDTAVSLAKHFEIEDLTNINLFLVAKDVEEALSTKDVHKCLAWCHDNKSKLRKMRSSLEFEVRLQEFVELIKSGKRMDAVKHARKHLSSNDPEQLPLIQRGMGLLAFPADTNVEPYRKMLREDRWQNLIEQFRTENFRLYQLSNQSVFAVSLQAGLSALKTTQCYRQSVDRNNECPVCHAALNKLAATLPFAHCSQSRLICHITGKPLDENNRPMMLPNGFVYGYGALAKMAQENDGQIVCPRTKEIYPIAEVEKVFVM
jgi:macrophage erythroblast attacher